MPGGSAMPNVRRAACCLRTATMSMRCSSRAWRRSVRESAAWRVQDLTRALSLAERYVDVHIALGILEFSDGRVPEAGRHFRRAVEINPARRPELAVWLTRVGDRS